MAQTENPEMFDDLAVGKVFRKLAYLNDGRLNIDDLLLEANHSSNPLHQHFQWDRDRGASERLWRRQARDLIERCSVKLPVEPFSDDPD